MPLTREQVFALIDEKIFTNNSAQIQAADVNALLKTIYDNAPNTGFEHYIGEVFGGGVIFHLWKDSEGVEHGLVVDTVDLSVSHAWSNVTSVLIGSSAQSTWNGLANSEAIVAQSGHTNSAAKLCLDSTRGGYSDWYLPSVDEMYLFFSNRFHVEKTFSVIGATPLFKQASYFYWTSTEHSSTHVYTFSWIFGNTNVSYNKSTYGQVFVRAIRQF